MCGIFSTTIRGFGEKITKSKVHLVLEIATRKKCSQVDASCVHLDAYPWKALDSGENNVLAY